MIAKQHTVASWPLIVDVASDSSLCKRMAPMRVGAFAELLSTRRVCSRALHTPAHLHTPADLHIFHALQFTSGSDRALVVDLYQQTLQTVLLGSSSLVYRELGWGDAEMAVLCELLPQCKKLQSLDLIYNHEFTVRVTRPKQIKRDVTFECSTVFLYRDGGKVTCPCCGRTLAWGYWRWPSVKVGCQSFVASISSRRASYGVSTGPQTRSCPRKSEMAYSLFCALDARCALIKSNKFS